jgi:hypothetical protein
MEDSALTLLLGKLPATLWCLAFCQQGIALVLQADDSRKGMTKILSERDALESWPGDSASPDRVKQEHGLTMRAARIKSYGWSA